MPATDSKSRKPLIWVMSFSRLSRLVESVMDDYLPYADIRIANRRFEDALQAARELIAAGEADVFVSAGANGAFLRRELTHPVVIIKVTGFDIMQALAQAARISKRVAIVTYEQVSPELDQFRRLYGLNLELRRYADQNDVRTQIAELVALGIKVVVGPSLVSDLAEEAGMTGIFLYSQESVRQALDDAVEAARLAHIEEARRERLNTILRHLREGVVAVDRDERIHSINPAMAELLGVSAEEVLGKPLTALAPELSLRETLSSGESDLERVERVRNRFIVASRIPIVEQGALAGAVLTFQDGSAIQRADRSLRTQNRPRNLVARYRLEQLLGTSPALQQTRALATRYAAIDSTVLITGESGTGKEILAQGIHNASKRRRHPFVAINCAAFPENLLESELFGYEEGAFTGSRRGGKPGLFELAHTGTIFLDEIGDMPVALQTRLLRVLQEREVMRLGSHEPTPIDVRVLAATHRDLRDRVDAGLFREDLFYRLSILRLTIPALRDRPEDIPVLLSHLVAQICRRLAIDRPPRPLLDLFTEHAMRYAWPGNVRELENAVERLVVSFADPPEEALFHTKHLRVVLPELFEAERVISVAHAIDLRTTSRNAERQHILKTVEVCRGNHAEAARRLGIGRTTLWRKLNAG